jgi:hypothetical protein
VLRSATLNPSAFLEKGEEFGQAVAGQRADLLLVNGNPLKDLSVLRNPEGVIVRGRWLSALELQKMLKRQLKLIPHRCSPQSRAVLTYPVVASPKSGWGKLRSRPGLMP